MEWYQQLDQWIQDIGYGIASIFGQGETANSIVNGFKQILGNPASLNKDAGWQYAHDTITKTATQLINLIMSKLGVKDKRLQEVLNLIDSKLGSLPIGNSQLLKKAFQHERASLIRDRQQVSKALNAVESSMNTAMSTTSMQDMIAPSRKVENQQTVDKLINNAEEATKDLDLDSIERRLK